MSEKEIVYTSDEVVSCKGKEFPYDHPLVYLNIDPEIGYVECLYCSKQFKLKRSQQRKSKSSQNIG